MFSINLSNPRFWVGLGTLLTTVLAVVWVFLPGMPVLIGPWALASSRASGQELFEHDWQVNDPLANGDGVGPVYNATSCVACHFQGGVGGGGDNSHNVRTFEVMPTKGSPDVKGGVVHAHALTPSLQESDTTVRQLYPVVKGRGFDFDPVNFTDVNSTALFGAGWIDCISDKAIESNRMRRLVKGAAKEMMADFNGVPVGRVRTLADGRTGKFGWKAQAATLEDFVAGACSNELGLGTPSKEQAKPMHHRDYPASPPDLNRKQFNNLVSFVSTLPRPVEVLPSDTTTRTQAIQGKHLFESVGCALCHTPDIGGVKGVYSDFLLYSVEDETSTVVPYYSVSPELPLPPEHPKLSEWKTPPLWGVADSAPYFHDGKSPTLHDAIVRHRAQAKSVSDRYSQLTPDDQKALLAFLMTLKAPSNATAVVKK